VSKNQHASETEVDTPARAVPANPWKNPSYPQRVHAHERPHWEGILASVEERVAAAHQKLNALGNSPRRASFDRLYAQMLGARDQVADAVRRLPGETGDLYEEDKHRVEEAVAALDRVARQWDAQPA
jgi:hypothetical protein